MKAAGAPRADHLEYVDWLRVLALTGVFLIHVCEVFNPWDQWHIVNTPRSRVLGEVIVLQAPWIMPLFMLLAGTSAAHSLARRTNARYLRERVFRVFIPLVIGLLVLVPPQVYAERVWRGQFHGSFFAFYPHFFQGLYPEGNFSWHHLWFLAHLFVYSVISIPIFRFWRTERGRDQLKAIARACSGPGGLLLLALPLVAERHLMWAIFARHQLFQGDWSNQSMLFVAYLYGFALVAEPALMRAVDAYWPLALGYASSCTTLLVVLTWTGVVPDTWPPAHAFGSLVFWTIYGVGAWAWIVAILGAGRRYLNAPAPILHYARSTGYAWYLLHQTIIVLIAARVVTWHAGIGMKFAAIFTSSLLLTTIGATLLSRGQSALRARRAAVLRAY